MPRWTKEQQTAIDEDGSNIIVSAGAGSGKTAVLSERVIRKLESGVDIDHLLILTFTKAAAFEMMIRIRNKIKERPKLKVQLDKIDSAYITTFDSYSLSLVKKYHYLLNIKRDIKILDQNIMNIERRKILDKIFDKYYKEENPKFYHLLNKFTLKDDDEIKNLILTINSKLDLKYDKLSYLKNYVNMTYNCDNVKKLLVEFDNFLINKIDEIKSSLDDLKEYVDGDYLSCLEDTLLPLFNSRTYDEIVKNTDIKLKNLPRGVDEEAKGKKEILSGLIKELKEFLIYEDRKQIYNLYMETKEDVEILIDIILALDNLVYIYKFERDSYEFTDISKMAIKLVLENKEINQELKYYFNEIMVDEYQDTSDLQETFIKAIENNNVYMVGDIKQSIYRFRNANPLIFKGKYDAYSNNDGGIKIDLMKNFRSRKEVLDNINYIFDYIMDDLLGGCNYKVGHRMVFGNMMYEEEKNISQNSNFEVYNYYLDKSLGYEKREVEAFIILKDIEEKIKSHYQVVDKETSKLRNITYSDFAILIDRATDFELYKKIFEFRSIPLTVYKDTSITREDDIYILSNLLKLIYLSYHKSFGEEFKYAFLSVSRSYLTDTTDKETFKIFKEGTYFESEIFIKIKPIIDKYDLLNGVGLLDEVIESFNFYSRQILVGNIEHLMARITYLKTLFSDMSNLGYSVDEVILNFNEMVDSGYDIKMSLSLESGNAVKIMTIHKSKGLEFPILYMAGLSNKFNIRDLNEKFIFDNNYGFIIPFYQDKEIMNISKVLMRNDYLKEEISEKIRLFYVALTRAREKMIFITSNDKEEESQLGEIVSNNIRYHYRSFLDILKSIWSNLIDYKKDINLDSIGLDKGYNDVRSSNYKDNLKKSREKIKYEEVVIEQQEETTSKFSKTSCELLTPDNYEAIELGKRFHSIFENLDFKKPDLSHLTIFEKEYVKAFLNLPIFKNMQLFNIYKEYEFVYKIGNEIKHGIIDLLVESSNEILIIDYKLKHTFDKAYLQQLTGYKGYISLKTDKKIKIYLYSILDKKLKEV